MSPVTSQTFSCQQRPDSGMVKKFLRESIASENMAVLDGENSYSYRHLMFLANGLLHRLRKKGLKQNDKILVELPNSLEFVLYYLACMLGGYTIIPVNRNLAQRDKTYIRSVTSPALIVEQPGSVDIFDPAAFESDDFVHLDDNPLYSISFTSGTTGNPKGIGHSVVNVVANVLAFNRLTGLNHHSRMMHVMPMSYMAGFLNTIFSPLCAGGNIVLAPEFSAATAFNFWTTAIRHSINAIWLSPSMAAILAQLNRADTVPSWTEKNLKHVFIGTAPLSPAIRRSFENTFGVRCYESYGMSEVMLVSCQTSESRSTSSVGFLLDGIDLKFAPSSGEGDGEIHIKTPYLFKNIIHDPNHSQKKTEHPADFFPTGDTGHLKENELYITGRIKDLIIRGGVNISPRAIEDVLMLHPAVRQTAVVGIPDSLMGEKVVAFVAIFPTGDPVDRELQNLCAAYLAPNAIPSEIIVLEQLPASSTGKIEKYKLKQQYMNEKGS